MPYLTSLQRGADESLKTCEITLVKQEEGDHHWCVTKRYQIHDGDELKNKKNTYEFHTYGEAVAVYESLIQDKKYAGYTVTSTLDRAPPPKKRSPTRDDEPTRKRVKHDDEDDKKEEISKTKVKEDEKSKSKEDVKKIMKKEEKDLEMKDEDDDEDVDDDTDEIYMECERSKDDTDEKHDDTPTTTLTTATKKFYHLIRAGPTLTAFFGYLTSDGKRDASAKKLITRMRTRDIARSKYIETVMEKQSKGYKSVKTRESVYLVMGKKYYYLSRYGRELYSAWGKTDPSHHPIDTPSQSSKVFATEEMAHVMYESTVQTKVEKGYLPMDGITLPEPTWDDDDKLILADVESTTLEDEKHEQFYRVKRSGLTLTTSHGPISTIGISTTTTSTNLKSAIALYTSRIASKQGQGYVIVEQERNGVVVTPTTTSSTSTSSSTSSITVSETSSTSSSTVTKKDAGRSKPRRDRDRDREDEEMEDVEEDKPSSKSTTKLKSKRLKEEEEKPKSKVKPKHEDEEEHKDIADGEVVQIGSYKIRNVGGIYSCTCPVWLFQKKGIERRTCKHIRSYRGDAAEDARMDECGIAAPSRPKKTDLGVLLAHKWDHSISPVGWWMSEKLDGMRALWDGEAMWSRTGNGLFPPAWFTASFPSYPLDGELFYERGQFDMCVSIARRSDGSDAWKKLKYVVFDAPKQKGTFEERYKFLQSTLKSEYAHVHPHTPCKSLEEMEKELVRIQSLKGEGLMLRKPGSLYVSGRSKTLLKVKTFTDDEALVIGYEDGKGKYKGQCGALKCQTRDGIEFGCGSGLSDALRADPPKIGTVITFKYQELTKDKVPRFPTFLRIRPDVSASEFRHK